MDRVDLQDGLSLSRLVLGKWRLTDYGDSSPAAVQERIEAALAQGVTTLDQADIYGGYMAEEVLGRALTPALKDQIEIVTKCDIVAPVGRHAAAKVKHYDTSRAHIEASVDHSLRLMGLDTIDLLLIHRPDPLMDAAETGAALDAVVASGKVRAVGVSNFKRHDWTLLQSAMQTKLVTNQIEISLVENAAFTNGDLAFCQEFGVPPMAWSPLAGGTLFAGSKGDLLTALTEYGAAQGVDASAVAIAWLLRHPARIMPVLGTNSLERIQKMSDATRVEMSREDWFALYQVANGHEVP